MKCNQCECIFPPSYSACPQCGSNSYEVEKYRQQFMFEEIEEENPIDVFVVGSSFYLLLALLLMMR